MPFPVASTLGFLKATPLRFRRTRSVHYSEIRLISLVSAHGFISFLSPVDMSSNIYNQLYFNIAFSTGESVSATWTIHDNADYYGTGTDKDQLVTVFAPSEAAYRAALASALASGITGGATSKTATDLVQSFTVDGSSPTTTITQTFNLSNSIHINYWRQLAVDRLAALVSRTLDVGYDLDPDHWDTFIYTLPGMPDYISNTDLTPYVPNLVKPPLGNAEGRVLQAAYGPVIPPDPVAPLLEIFGIEGGKYHPGLLLQDRRAPVVRLIFTVGGPDTNPMTELIPDVTTDPMWQTGTLVTASHVRHRIQQSPVYVILDVRAIQDGGGLGPDNYSGVPATPTTGSPVDQYGRVQFDTVCPNPFSGALFQMTPEDFGVFQIYSLNASTNVNGFVIPP